MHSLKTLLQLPCGWQSSRQDVSSDGITLHLRAKRKTALCPECLKRSKSVHSCRRRRIQHLPCSGLALWLVFAVRHWYCSNPACSRKIFAESLAPFAGARQQSSPVLAVRPVTTPQNRPPMPGHSGKTRYPFLWANVWGISPPPSPARCSRASAAF